MTRTHATLSGAPQVCAKFGADSNEICADELYYDQTLDHFRFTSKMHRLLPQLPLVLYYADGIIEEPWVMLYIR